MRSLLVAMDRWLSDGETPPISRYPKLDENQLVTLAALRFPRALDARPPKLLPRAYRMDYGPRFASERIIERAPPVLGAAYPMLVPQVDDDGNEITGLRSPELARQNTK